MTLELNRIDFHFAEKREASERRRMKSISILPMEAGEAARRMELSGYQFFLFTDVRSGKPCIVFKKADGTCGVLATE